MKKYTFSVLFWINKDKIRRDGRAPIYCRITIRGRRIEIATHHHILPSEWQDKKVCNNDPINESLSKLHEKIFQIKDKLMMSGKEISPHKIRETLFNNHTNLIANKREIKIADKKEIKCEKNNFTSSFGEAGLSMRPIKVLASYGICTFRDLTKFSRTDIEKSRDIGKNTLAKLDAAMSRLNLSWNQDGDVTKKTFRTIMSPEKKIINKERRKTIKILENILKMLQKYNRQRIRIYISRARYKLLNSIKLNSMK